MRASALKIRMQAMVALLSLAAESALSQSAGENYVSHQVLLSGDGSSVPARAATRAMRPPTLPAVSLDSVDYMYGGKELDRMHGLDLYDYSARQYDAALGRFTSMGPLCEKYYHISPYAYCAGNPVKYVDPTGGFIMCRGVDGNFYRYESFILMVQMAPIRIPE